MVLILPAVLLAALGLGLGAGGSLLPAFLPSPFFRKVRKERLPGLEEQLAQGPAGFLPAEGQRGLGVRQEELIRQSGQQQILQPIQEVERSRRAAQAAEAGPARELERIREETSRAAGAAGLSLEEMIRGADIQERAREEQEAQRQFELAQAEQFALEQLLEQRRQQQLQAVGNVAQAGGGLALGLSAGQPLAAAAGIAGGAAPTTTSGSQALFNAGFTPDQIQRLQAQGVSDLQMQQAAADWATLQAQLAAIGAPSAPGGV